MSGFRQLANSSPSPIPRDLLSSSEAHSFLTKSFKTPQHLQINDSPQPDVFSSHFNSFGTSHRPQMHSQLASLPGPSGRSRVGLGVSISTVMSRDQDNEWRESVDSPLSAMANFLTKNCVVCFLEGKTEYIYHRLENCSQSKIGKTDNDYYRFRMSFNYPTKMCYGCGLHTGVIFFFLPIL
jgi:hypothetical protein